MGDEMKKCVLAASLLALAGCAGGEGIAAFQQERGFEGSAVILERKKSFVKVDLAQLLDPHDLGRRDAKRPGADEIELAFNGFYSSAYGTLDIIQRRNRVQDRLIAASNQACLEFKRHIHRLQAEGNFGFGVLSVITGGAGAITTATSAARILSGVTGILSGARAEFNQDFFARFTATVLTKAIDNRRDELIRKLQTPRASDIAAYTVEMAIADALVYNDSCSLVSALQVTDTALTVAEDPGIKRLNEVLLSANISPSVLFKGTVEGVNLPLPPKLALGGTTILGQADANLALKQIRDQQAKLLKESVDRHDALKKEAATKTQAVKDAANKIIDKAKGDLDTANTTFGGALPAGPAGGTDPTAAAADAADLALINAYRKAQLEFADLERRKLLADADKAAADVEALKRKYQAELAKFRAVRDAAESQFDRVKGDLAGRS